MLTTNLASAQNSLYDIQRRISSGTKVAWPSDDPGAYEVIRNLHGDIARLQQYARNNDQAERELLAIDDVLQNTLGLFQRGSEIAIRASDATVSASDRQAMASEVNNLIESLVAKANHHEAGHYRFGGLRSDTAPYLTTDTNGDGWIDQVTYQGSDEVKRIEIGRGVYVGVTVPGTNLSGRNAAFQTASEDLFGSLIQLRDTLSAGLNPVDTENFTAQAVTDTLAVSRPYRTGTAVELSTKGTLPAGLSANTTYYAISVPGAIQLAASLDDARNGIAIDITSAGAGTFTIKQKALEELNRGVDHVTSMLSIIGAREEAVTNQHDILIQQESTITTALEKAESVDIAQAMVELSSRQTAYQAALKASAVFMNSPSLVDFI
jgi:flagellar hook-associated protein 3